MRTTPNGRGLGWRRQIPDHRDALYTFQTPLHIAKNLPRSVDLRDKCPAPYNQGPLGSCTGQGVAGAMHFDLIQQGAKPPAPPSRLMIYYGARAIENDVPYDAGAQVRDAIKASTAGVCFEDLWPYDTEQFATKPNAKCYTAGAKNRARLYRPVNQVAYAIRGCLAAKYPIVFGFTCYTALDSDEVARTGKLPMPGLNEAPIGGHCVLIVGYNTDDRYYIVRNSWGPEWGDEGYFYMPFPYVERADLSSDFWMIQTVG